MCKAILAFSLLLAGLCSAAQSTSTGTSPSTTGADAGTPGPTGAQASNSSLNLGNAAPPGFTAFSSDGGFSFDYPSDWEVLDAKPMMPAIQLKAEEKATTDMEKKGINCSQIALLLRHGVPASSLVVMVLPYGCVGPALNSNELAASAEGISVGIQKTYEIADPAYGAYKLGKHDLWIEHAQATSKAHPDQHFTIEIVCVMLKKAMVCWIVLGRDEDAIKMIEKSQVALDEDAVAVLVPATALNGKKP